MTPSKKAKQLGCESLARVSTVSGVPVQTLRDWFVSRPFVFGAVCREVVRYEKHIATEYGLQAQLVRPLPPRLCVITGGEI